jgi:hypothetical protein
MNFSDGLLQMGDYWKLQIWSKKFPVKMELLLKKILPLLNNVELTIKVTNHDKKVIIFLYITNRDSSQKKCQIYIF